MLFIKLTLILLIFGFGYHNFTMAVQQKEVSYPIAANASVIAIAAKNVARSASTVFAHASFAITADGHLAGIILTMAAHIAAGTYADCVGQCL